jgi:hypothetical protein
VDSILLKRILGCRCRFNLLALGEFKALNLLKPFIGFDNGLLVLQVLAVSCASSLMLLESLSWESPVAEKALPRTSVHV